MALSEYYSGWGRTSDEQLEADVEQSDKYAEEDAKAKQALKAAVSDAINASDASKHQQVVEAVAPKLSRKERLAMKRAGKLPAAGEIASNSAGAASADSSGNRLEAFASAMQQLHNINDLIESRNADVVAPAKLAETVSRAAQQYDRLLQLSPPETQAELSTQVKQETSHTEIKRRHDHGGCGGHSEPHTCSASCTAKADAATGEGHDCRHTHHEHKAEETLPAATISLLRRCALAARHVHSLALYRLAARQLQAGQADACIATCRRLLFQHPTFTRGWLLRGKAFACVGALLLAQLHFDRALQLDGLKPGAVEVHTPHLEDISFALSSFDLRTVHSQDTRDDLSGSTAAAAPAAGAAPPVAPHSLARIQPRQYRQFVGHLLSKCFTSMACKRWLAAALDGTCHWDRACLVQLHALAWAAPPAGGDETPLASGGGGTAAAAAMLPPFMGSALQPVAPSSLQMEPHGTAQRPRMWAHLLFTRRIGRVLFREGFYYSAAAAFEAVAGGAAAAVAVAAAGGDAGLLSAARVLLAASLLNFAACLMKRRVQLGSAVQACDAAVVQLSAAEAAVHAAPADAAAPARDSASARPVAGANTGGAASAGDDVVGATADRFELRDHETDGVNTAPDAVFRLRMKCMFRKGQCLVDTGEYGAGLVALMAAQGELQDALATGEGGEGGALRSLLRPVQRALQRGKYIAQHSKRIVAQ